MKETEMYPPLKKFLRTKGYVVHSEVDDIDVLAKKGDEYCIIEMKTSFTMKLVFQLIERLKITDQVYAYVPLGKGGRWPKEYKKMCALLKRLELGLITLDINKDNLVTMEFEPKKFTGRTNYKKKKSVLKEFEGRRVDLNLGGSTKEKIFTVYKEKAIRVAMFLFKHGAATPKEIRSQLEIEQVLSILTQNHYKWFNRVKHGVYESAPAFEEFYTDNKVKISQLVR